MWAGILAFFTQGAKVLIALPTILKAFNELVGWLEVQFGPNWPERLADLKAASQQWSKAVTPRERADAASALAKAFNSRK